MAETADEIVRRTIEQANRLLGGSAPQAVLEIMKDAEATLLPKLKALRGGKGKATWSEANTQAMLSQVQLTTAYAQKRLLGLTHAQATEAVKAGFTKTTKLIHALEKHHTGVVRPLELDKAAKMREAVSGTAASLLSRHQSSVNRYGAALINDFNRVLRTGLAVGLSNDEMIKALISAGAAKGIGAKSLNETEPRYFPAPTGFVKQRYWAERIVRTERAYSYNLANYEAIGAFVKQDPKGRKKIVALIGDKRTAPDSIAVHGQIREWKNNFCDGAGRVYLFPPARPNDRESIIPWHQDWKELDSTKQLPAGEVEAATKEATEQAEGNKTGHAEMMALVAAKKAEILAKEKPAPKPQKVTKQKEGQQEKPAKLVVKADPKAEKAAQVAEKAAQKALATQTKKANAELLAVAKKAEAEAKKQETQIAKDKAKEEAKAKKAEELAAKKALAAAAAKKAKAEAKAKAAAAHAAAVKQASDQVKAAAQKLEAEKKAKGGVASAASTKAEPGKAKPTGSSPVEACAVLAKNGVRRMDQNGRHLLFMLLGEDPKQALADAKIELASEAAATYV